MLFDLRSGKRRRLVQVVYTLLAASFLIGFVIFGIGSEGGGGIGDLFSGGGGGTATGQYDDRIESAQQDLEQDPKDTKAMLVLVDNYYLKGRAELEAPSDPTQAPVLTDEARADLGAAVDTWERYVKTEKGQPDVDTATSVVQAYFLLQNAVGAARTQEIVADAKPSAGAYNQLAFFSYASGDISGGDAAATKAVAEAPPAQKKQLESQLDQIAEQARKALKQQKKIPEGAAQTQLQNPFGGFGGSSAPVPRGG